MSPANTCSLIIFLEFWHMKPVRKQQNTAKCHPHHVLAMYCSRHETQVCRDSTRWNSHSQRVRTLSGKKHTKSLCQSWVLRARRMGMSLETAFTKACTSHAPGMHSCGAPASANQHETAKGRGARTADDDGTPRQTVRKDRDEVVVGAAHVARVRHAALVHHVHKGLLRIPRLQQADACP